jgi:hypothetical protein
MTKEHIWGKWIRAYVPAGATKHTLRDTEMVKWNSPERVSIINKPGNAIGLFRKIVCSPCNNGFMSRLQNRVRRHLIPFLDGRRTVIGETEQAAIAAWATMVTMTAEFMLDGSKLGISGAARAELMRTEKPLPDWKVWIANYRGGQWAHQWSHTSVPIIGDKQLPNAEHVYTPLPNTQTTTFVLGRLYVHTMSASYPDLVANWHWLHNSRLKSLLVPIWPVRQQFLAWPVHGIDDADVRVSSEMFIRHIDMIARQTHH